MKIRKTITLKWLKSKGASQECLDGFESDFGIKRLKTRDVVGALTEKRYPHDARCYVSTLYNMLIPKQRRIMSCAQLTCFDCPDAKSWRRMIYVELRK